jgi:hypothetical protein
VVEEDSGSGKVIGGWGRRCVVMVVVWVVAHSVTSPRRLVLSQRSPAVLGQVSAVDKKIRFTCIGKVIGKRLMFLATMMKTMEVVL